jgi:hypothetical protein
VTSEFASGTIAIDRTDFHGLKCVIPSDLNTLPVSLDAFSVRENRVGLEWIIDVSVRSGLV